MKTKRLLWLLLLGFLLGGCSTKPPTVFQARVVAVTDGDTVKVLYGPGGPAELKIRLYGIDAPEKKQPFGQRSKMALSNLVFGREVEVQVKDKDRYGRLVSVLRSGSLDINQEMVASGMAWWYQHYAPHDQLLAKAQARARERRLGLWSDPNPVPPWQFRKQPALQR